MELRGPQIGCDLAIDSPGAVAHNELVVSGWAVSPDGVGNVLITVGDRAFNASYGLDTPALAAKLSGAPGAERAGYRLRLDTADWQPGSRPIAVAVYDESGKRAELKGEVTIRPYEPAAGTAESQRERIAAGKVAISLDTPRLLDRPAEIAGAVAIEGWAHAEGGVEAVIVTVDGALQHEALRPIARPDLLAEHGSEVALNAGFVSRLQGAECTPGRHSLTVVALGPDGAAAGVQGEFVARPSVAGDGELEIAWRDNLERPQQRDGKRDPADERTHWEDRALLAEADAAESRAAARLAHETQRSFVGAWRTVEARSRKLDTAEKELETRTAELEEARGYLRGAEELLEQARADREVASEELTARTAELEEARRYLRGAEELLEQRTAELAHVVDSASWRVTRPLRALKRWARLLARRPGNV